MKQLYVDLTGKNMNAIIIFVTPMKRTLVSGGSTIAWDSANTAGYKLADYVNAIKDFCSNYGCPVLDLFNESGISNRTASTMLYDGLHPFLETNKRIGKMIANKINMYI
jgi:lysophospholipase L1-like esterase